MTKEITVKVHEIAVDGLPDMEKLVCKVAFVWNGSIVSGWPLDSVGKAGLWETDEDALGMRPFSGVTHWVEFPIPIHALERQANKDDDQGDGDES